MTKGKFIVIDGLDGSGKTTQLKLLLDFFKKKGIKTETIDFPQYYKTFFGRTVARYLKGEFGSLKQTNPYLSALTYAGDRWQAKEKIEKALKQGKTLLANRYTSSSLAFMAGKFKSKKEQDKIIAWIRKLEQKVYGCPWEDLLIYLSVPADLGQNLVLKKGKRKYIGSKAKLDLHEEDLAYLKRVGRVYTRLVSHYNHWIKIDCLDKKGNLKTKKEIHKKILNLLIKDNDRFFLQDL
jgi:dTMP kinase